MGQVQRRQARLVGTRVQAGRLKAVWLKTGRLKAVWLKAVWLKCSQRETRGMGLPEVEWVGQQPNPQPAQPNRQQDLGREPLPQQQPGQQGREGGVQVLDHRGGPEG